MLSSGAVQITNSTTSGYNYTCEIDPNVVQYIQHASGTCMLNGPHPAIEAHLTTSSVLAPCSNVPANSDINVTFIATAQTNSSQMVYLVGSVPELGNWAPSSALPMSSPNNDGLVTSALWSVSVALPAQEEVQYKYMMGQPDGELDWECCENRAYAVPTAQTACTTEEDGAQTVAGNDPDYFRE